jgi:hypothetical protein
MSRSRRKTAIIGVTTVPSDKPFKVDEHRAERHAVRAKVKRSLDSDDRALHSKVYGDPLSTIRQHHLVEVALELLREVV